MEKKVIEATVRSNRQIAKGVFMMILEAPEAAASAKTGQFLNVYPRARHTLLPRPISICMHDATALTLVYGVVGEGTAEFSGYVEGSTIRVSTPLGNGFDIRGIISEQGSGSTAPDKTARAKAVLVGGGIGVPPLAGLARELVSAGIGCTAVLGFRDEPFLVDLFESMGVETLVSTDSGRYGRRGTTLDAIRGAGIDSGHFFACGPKAMLRSLNAYCTEISAPVQISMEERMGCGYGACVGCACKVFDSSDGAEGSDRRTVYKKVCTDGPVFDGRDVVWDA